MERLCKTCSDLAETVFIRLQPRPVSSVCDLVAHPCAADMEYGVLQGAFLSQWLRGDSFTRALNSSAETHCAARHISAATNRVCRSQKSDYSSPYS